MGGASRRLCEGEWFSSIGIGLESLGKGSVSPCNTVEGLAKEQEFKEAPQGISM